MKLTANAAEFEHQTHIRSDFSLLTEIAMKIEHPE